MEDPQASGGYGCVMAALFLAGMASASAWFVFGFVAS